MINDKLLQLKQDMNEVEGAIGELSDYNSENIGEENCTIKDTYEYNDLIDKFQLLKEHLKDHIEDVEIFIGRTN